LVDSNLRDRIYQAEQKSSSTDVTKRLEALEESQSYIIRTIQDIEMKQENPEYQKANESPEYSSSSSTSEEEILRNLDRGMAMKLTLLEDSRRKISFFFKNSISDQHIDFLTKI